MGKAKHFYPVFFKAESVGNQTEGEKNKYINTTATEELIRESEGKRKHRRLKERFYE